ncbi:MAG: flagellar filament capping protein FliD [Pseudomonadota bacterium]
MVSQIQIGNFFKFGGKTVSNGVGGSGIDTEALIKGLTEAKSIPATQLQDKIDVNASKATALGEFKSLLGKLKDSVAILRNPPGVGNAADNAFKYRTAVISSNTEVSGLEYVVATASPGTALQSYTVSEITSIAKARKQSTGNINIATANDAAVSAAPAAGQFKAGTFTLKGESITLNDGESLNSVAAKFNSISDKTGISASIIKVGTGVYQLSFASTKTGTDVDFDFNNVSPAGTLVDATGVFTQVTISDKQQASNAVFKFNGVSITRQGNTISDLVDGLSLTIKKDMVAAPLTEVGVSIEADQNIGKNSIINFVNLYNELKVFAAKQSELDDNGLYKDTAVLSDSALLRNTMSSVGGILSSIVSGLGLNAPSRLADVGITFIDQEATTDSPSVRNLMSVDDTKLSTAIANDPDAVRKIFEFDFVTDNTSLRIFSRTNALKATDFDLTITPSTSTYKATYDDGSGPEIVDLDAIEIKNASTGVVTGYTLKGKVGTAFEGLVMVYASTADGTASVNATQGIADKIFNVSDAVLKSNTGTLAVELNALKDSDTRLKENIDRINAQVEVFRQQLLDKFARLEQAISNVNTLLSSLQANDDARNGINS